MSSDSELHPRSSETEQRSQGITPTTSAAGTLKAARGVCTESSSRATRGQAAQGKLRARRAIIYHTSLVRHLPIPLTLCALARMPSLSSIHRYRPSTVWLSQPVALQQRGATEYRALLIFRSASALGQQTRSLYHARLCS